MKLNTSQGGSSRLWLPPGIIIFLELMFLSIILDDPALMIIFFMNILLFIVFFVLLIVAIVKKRKILPYVLAVLACSILIFFYAVIGGTKFAESGKVPKSLSASAQSSNSLTNPSKTNDNWFTYKARLNNNAPRAVIEDRV